MISKSHWSPGSDVSVQSVERSESGGWIVSGSLTPNGICPDCGFHSPRRHGWRRRRLQDYPAHGDEVTVDLAVCRWRCLAPACPRRTFSDQIASIARPFARRTSRVGEIVCHLGHATGGRLLHRLGLKISDDTVLRQLKKRAQGTAEPPTVIGIDDWSWRKSQTYGTIIVDLERRVVAAAKHRGVYRGRLPRIDIATIQAKLSEGLSPTEIARDMRISRGTVYKAKALM